MIARVGKATLAVGRGMFVAVLVSCTLAAASLAIEADDKAGPLHWYKGCTHAHSLWSDGDNPPEMVVDWYKSHGYQFFALTDHNVLMTGQRWYKVPPQYRALYEIYPAKACIDETAKQCHLCMKGRIYSIGREIGEGQGSRQRILKANY